MPNNKIKLRQEVSPRASNNISLLPDCLFVISLLSQFQNLKVRSDYTSGLFKLQKHSSNVPLSELDLLWRLLNSSWLGISCSMVRERTQHAMSQLVNLVSGKDELFVINIASGAPIHTFYEWHCILKDLANCSYWGEMPEGASLNSEVLHRPCETTSVCVNTDSIIVEHKFSNTVTPALNDIAISTIDMGIDKSTCISHKYSSCINEVKSDGGFSSCNDVAKSLSLPKGKIPKMCVENAVSGDHNGLPFNMTKGQVNMSHSIKKCAWCNKHGHVEALCWRKKGLCLICGNHHAMTDCPRYIAPPLPKCSICNGNHFGRFCLSIKKEPLFCYWCGKYGHTEDRCWVKLGYCLICGSSEHQLLHCPMNIYQRLPALPPQYVYSSLPNGELCDSRDET